MRPAFVDFNLLFAALLIGLVGAGFLLAAAYGALARSLGPEMGALIIGGSLTAVAAGILLVARHRRQAKTRAQRLAEETATDEAGLQGAGVTAAFVTAFVLARRMTRRNRN